MIMIRTQCLRLYFNYFFFYLGIENDTTISARHDMN